MRKYFYLHWHALLTSNHHDDCFIFYLIDCQVDKKSKLSLPTGMMMMVMMMILVCLSLTRKVGLHPPVEAVMWHYMIVSIIHLNAAYIGYEEFIIVFDLDYTGFSCRQTLLCFVVLLPIPAFVWECHHTKVYIFKCNTSHQIGLDSNVSDNHELIKVMYLV